jgi:hypothetical protein
MGLMYDSTIGPFDTEQGYKGFLSLSPDKLSYAKPAKMYGYRLSTNPLSTVVFMYGHFIISP